MNYKKINKDLLSSQRLLRIQLLELAIKFDINKTKFLLEKEIETLTIIEGVLSNLKDSSEKKYFENYKLLIITLFHMIRWVDYAFSGDPASDSNLKAAKLNSKQIDFSHFNYSAVFISKIDALIESIQNLADVENSKSVFADFCKIPFPTLFVFEQTRFENPHLDSISKDAENEDIILMSIEFIVDNEPWANPQLLKPQEIYTIKGKIKLNKWPKGYRKLILSPISAQNSSLYELILPEIAKADGEIEITGQVVFKYPQHSFDEPIIIKLLAYFINDSQKQLPTIIGYDQLIANVLDPNSVQFITGFKGMNKVAFDTIAAIKKEFRTIPSEEIEQFSLLLNGILNYQGYCLMQGIYKDVSSMPENTFRDQLIQHLIGIQYLGDAIIKEADLAGGRVEISYRGLIAELKVEKQISKRDKLIKKYQNQAVAYSSGNAKQLSILCVLDLTEKKLPPAAPQNNVFLITPKVHGFENTEPPFPPKQVVVIIDGNTIKPSSYSK